MKAAVLHELGEAPRYEDFPEPAVEEGKTMAQVKTAALNNIDKMLADGTHYYRHERLPAVCGLSGVAVLEDGTRVIAGSPPPYGMMAERAAVSPEHCLPVPDGVDDATAAALPNPALSAWAALEWRARLEVGETVLVLGATGVAGKLAVQVAKHLGAGLVVGAGRNERVLETLPDLGADGTVSLGQPDRGLAEAFREASGGDGFDVVLDYLWGRPAEVLVGALTDHEPKAEASRIRLVQIGEMAGPTIKLPAAALRSSGLEIMGSGGGSVSMEDVTALFPKLLDLAARGELRVDTEQVPLADVEGAWRRDQEGRRLVVVP
jgi:NADPH:quinone reductase-like Zn-dependent oxidoreductase